MSWGNGFHSLDKLCETIIDCEHKTAPIQDTGIPSIRTTNIKNGRIDFRSANKVSEETYKKWTSRREPKPGDLILAREAPVGEVGIIPPNQRACLGQRTVLISPNRDVLEPRYLCYLLVTPEMRHEMICRAEGSTVPHLNMSDIRGLQIPPIPPLPEQRAIAHILGTLDDKIELNRRMNETLEATARAIFKSWFVDFDPVRAKLNGQRPPGMDEETAVLFPDEFEDSELGKIPKGWKVDTLTNLCESITSGGTPRTKTEEYWGGGIPWLSSGETGNAYIIETQKTITPLGIENSSTRYVRAGATVIASAGQGKTRGQTSLLMIDTYINQSTIALTANSEQCSDSFLFFDLSCRYQEFRRISDAHSSRGSLTTKLLANLPVVAPTIEIINQFDRYIVPLVDRIRENLQESHTLTILRDTLLPKLLSGELRVPDAEKAIQEAV